jgi:hypothetical protein
MDWITDNPALALAFTAALLVLIVWLGRQS